MIKNLTAIQISIGIHFYIYLSSVVFLILSLFFNDKKEISSNPNDNPQQVTNNSNNELNENYFVFTYFLTGIKEIPLNTIILLVNNKSDNSLDLIYSLNNNDKDSRTIKLPIDSIKDISFVGRVRMQNSNKKIDENETKSALLSAVVFGGSPILQLAGNSGFNSLFNSLSNNYNKVDYNAYYEITIKTSMNNQDLNLILTTDTSPEIFIKKILNKKKLLDIN